MRLGRLFRLKALSDKRIRNYSLYALGEILLIIVGVNIAL